MEDPAAIEQQVVVSRKRSLPNNSNNDTTKSGSLVVPFRNVSQLYVHPLTLQCAESDCLVCAYKVACFDVALDKEFTKVWPNQRPEMCPRLRRHHADAAVSTTSLNTRSSAIQDHWPCLQGNARILTVGDGDFSYSVALSRHLRQGAQDAQGILTATSYESKATLEKVYRSEVLESHWNELKQAGATIRFEVDATRLPNDLQQTTWDLVVWNFPCTAVTGGQDGQNQAMEDNKDLVRQFCRNVQAKEIHLAHKTKPPYDQWGLVELVTSVSRADGCWNYVGRFVLDRALLPPYIPRKALDQKSFPCHDACTHVFQRSTAKPWLDSTLIPVTKERLQNLRDYWLVQKTLERTSKQQKKGRRRR